MSCGRDEATMNNPSCAGLRSGGHSSELGKEGCWCGEKEKGEADGCGAGAERKDRRRADLPPPPLSLSLGLTQTRRKLRLSLRRHALSLIHQRAQEPDGHLWTQTRVLSPQRFQRSCALKRSILIYPSLSFHLYALEFSLVFGCFFPGQERNNRGFKMPDF